MRAVITNFLADYVSDCKQKGLYRQRTVISQQAGCLNFSSNDYLSLTMDSRIQKAYQTGFMHYPTGSGGSMLVSGYHPIHQALERAFSDALHVDACVIVSSGYAANLSLMSVLSTVNAHVLLDKAAHASMYDGLRLSAVKHTRFLHNDLADAALKMKRLPERSALVTESIFSMSGQISPLSDFAQLATDHKMTLLVDEAHAFGVLGREGLGGVVHHGLTQEEVPLRVIPLGKACAGSGAIVAGQAVWIDALLQTARSHRYSTAVSPAYAYGLLETLDVLRQADARRASLSETVAYFREQIHHSPLIWRDSETPIQQVQFGCPKRAVAVAERLKQQGIVCVPMRQPTVSLPETGLRVMLNYCHTPQDIDTFFNRLHAL